MRHLTWLTVFGVIGLAVARVQAQPATQEQIDRARHVLHKLTVGQPAAAGRSCLRTNAPIVNAKPESTAASPGGIGTLTAEKEKQAREVLKNMHNRSQPAAFPTQKSPAVGQQSDASAREAARQQALTE